MRSLIRIFCLLVVACAASADQLLFKVIPNAAETVVEFTSDAPLETITGRTQTATGFLEIWAAPGGGSGRSEIHVDLASLSTGLSLRDRHMRENHLETDRYPEAVFILTSLQIPSGDLVEGIRTSVQVSGNLTLHGVTRELRPETFLTLGDDASTLRIEAQFPIKLSDYQIARPQFLVMKLSELQMIKVDLLTVRSDAFARPK